MCPSHRVQNKETTRASRAGDFHLGAGLVELLCVREVGSLRGAVVAMRMCVVMHCAMAFWWGCSLGALSLLFLCDVPLVLLRDCFCVALQMLSVVHLMAIAAPDHSTRAVYFAAIMVFKAQAAIIEVTASSGGGGFGATEPTYQFSDLSGTP